MADPVASRAAGVVNMKILTFMFIGLVAAAVEAAAAADILYVYISAAALLAGLGPFLAAVIVALENAGMPMRDAAGRLCTDRRG
jgi:hypothetical protein